VWIGQPSRNCARWSCSLNVGRRAGAQGNVDIVAFTAFVFGSVWFHFWKEKAKIYG
jgi:hypothetical protein